MLFAWNHRFSLAFMPEIIMRHGIAVGTPLSPTGPWRHAGRAGFGLRF